MKRRTYSYMEVTTYGTRMAQQSENSSLYIVHGIDFAATGRSHINPSNTRLLPHLPYNNIVTEHVGTCFEHVSYAPFGKKKNIVSSLFC